MNKPLVSISCITYNHAPYIRQCLDGFIMQKTTFPVEILIHDDASTDGTADIIREYEQKYPDIIKPIYQTENQYSKGMSISAEFIFPRVKGKYLAICEGDDYWTDPLKLQKQVDFMEANKDFSICFHPVDVYDQNSEKIMPNFTVKDVDSVTDIKDIAKENYINTLSVMYRYNEKAINDYKNKPKVEVGDYYLHLLFAQYGKIKRLSDNMGVYRIHSSSSWSSKPMEYIYPRWLKLLEALINHFNKNIEVCNNLKEQYFIRAKEICFNNNIKNNVNSKKEILDTIYNFSKELAYELYFTPEKYYESKIFLDTGNGFNEYEILCTQYNINNNYFEISFILPSNVKSIRFDPIEGCSCIIDNIKIIADNELTEHSCMNGFEYNNLYIFDTFDPQILINLKSKEYKKLTISGYIHFYFCKDIYVSSKIVNMRNELISQCESLTEQNNSLNGQVNSLLNSRSWRITKPLRDLTAFIRRHKVLRLFAKGLLSLKRYGVLGTFRKVFIYFNKNKKITIQPTEKQLKQWAKENVQKDIKYDERIFKNEVDIIIPVYNGYDYLDSLFSSIPKTEVPFRLLIIDDKSTDERIVPFLENIKTRIKNTILISNEENLGFVKSVNKALLMAKNHVVILNTDVEVPEKWLERLISPFYKDPKIASATPFTNSGTICSFPDFCKDNSLFEQLPLDKIDSGFQLIKPKYIQLPTGVGFCMGMNREALIDIGIFDEVSFNKGYGEENDWCQRAIKAGYKNVLVENLFVYHKHGGSFLREDKKTYSENNHKIVLEKHPNYNTDVALHIYNDPAKQTKEYVSMYLINKYKG